MNAHRKKFLKDKKEYEKMLKTKAKLGTLSLAEKEQYQSMIHSKRRNIAFKKEKIAGIIVSIGTTLVLFLIYYIGPNILQGQNADPYLYEERYEVQQAMEEDAEYDALFDKLDRYIELANETNLNFNKGVQNYNLNEKVGEDAILNLKKVDCNEEDEQFKALGKIIDQKRNIQIDILKRLGDSGESREQLKKDCEEITKLDLAFKKEFKTILDQEELHGPIQFEPVNFYVTK